MHKTTDDVHMVEGLFHSARPDGRVQCDVCPRKCQLREGQRGFCFVRERRGEDVILTTWGRSSGFCIDPIEKKPLHHFLPGTSVLSFGTAGCNLGCKFCQNWDISKSRESHKLTQRALPDAIASAAVDHGCSSVAFTYNDPTIWLEYAVDTAVACHARGVATVAVTAGYIAPAARELFFEHIDAANIDLKAFTESFYRSTAAGSLREVLDTLEYVTRETTTWVEITNLLIPDANDSDAEIDEMTRWIVKHLGTEVPLHFSAFHPDFKMRDRPRTPLETLVRARQIALGNGIQHVYTGNVHFQDGDTTFCASCDAALIERDWYELRKYVVTEASCPRCKRPLAGVYRQSPGNWGRRRQRVDMSQYVGKP